VYDAIFLATIVGFFLLCVAYIRGCDRIIGPEAEIEAVTDDELGQEGVPTPVGPPPAERAA
jgi:hypothetical protein